VIRHNTLSEFDAATRNLLWTKARQKFIFEVNEDDAKKFATIFPPHVQASHLSDQGQYQCYAKLGTTTVHLETYPRFATVYSKTKGKRSRGHST
jgi:hypothetical protein